MTLNEFISKYDGKGIDFDGAFGFQCVDLYRQYCKEVLGLIQSPPVAGAVDIWTTYLKDKFSQIANTPTGIPQRGDILIWGKDLGPYGHVAIFLEGTVNSFKSFDQNYPTGSLCHTQDHSYDHLLGWLRPNEIINTNIMDKLFLDAGIDTESEVRECIDRYQKWDQLQTDKANADGEINSLKNQLEIANAKILEITNQYANDKNILEEKIKVLQELEQTDHSWADTADKLERRLRVITDFLRATYGKDLSTESDGALFTSAISEIIDNAVSEAIAHEETVLGQIECPQDENLLATFNLFKMIIKIYKK